MNAPTLNYRDAAQCMTLIAELPLTNVPRVRDTLTRMLYGLRQTPPRSNDYLAVLEAMRPPLHFLQESLGKRYSSRPVAPGSADDGVLRQVVALWLAMAQAYAQAAENAGVHPLDDLRMAQVCQRCVLYAGRAVLEYFRARRTVPRGLWLELHGYFSTAEEWGFATQPVPDGLKEGGYPQSAAESYCSVLLVDLSNPYGRSPREFEWVCRWAEQYAGLTEIMPVFGGTDARTYAVDLNQTAGRGRWKYSPARLICAGSVRLDWPARSKGWSQGCVRASRLKHSGWAPTVIRCRQAACCCSSTNRGATPPIRAAFSDARARATSKWR